MFINLDCLLYIYGQLIVLLNVLNEGWMNLIISHLYGIIRLDIACCVLSSILLTLLTVDITCVNNIVIIIKVHLLTLNIKASSYPSSN